MPLSQRQMEYAIIAFQCCTEEPKPDFEAFRAAAGLASANSARELWRVTRKKMKEEYEGLCQKVVDEKKGGTGSVTGGTPKTPKTASPKKRAAPSATKTKTKASAGAGVKKKDSAVPSEATGSEDGDGEEAPASKKRKTAATKVKAEPKDEVAGDEDAEGEDDYFT